MRKLFWHKPLDAVTADCDFTGIAWAAKNAKDGDTLAMRAGVYREAAILRAAHLTIRAAPGAHMKGVAAEEKAALVVKGHDIVIEGLECSGIAVSWGNGACVRAEGFKARSHARMHKERGMRQRRLKRLWRRLGVLQKQKLTRDQLLFKPGAAKKEAGRANGLVNVCLPTPEQGVNATTFPFALNKSKSGQVRRREGRYLLRSNLNGEDPVKLWQYYIQLTEIEQAFKELKLELPGQPAPRISHAEPQRRQSA